MKTLFTLALAGALSFSSLAAHASDDLMALSEVKARFKKVNVLLKGGVGEAKVALFDEAGRKLHSRKVSVGEMDVILPYDLKDLPTGEYAVKITTPQEQVVFKVETFEQPLAPAELPLVAFGKVIDDETVQLAVVGLEELGVNVVIRSAETNKLIHSEQVDQAEGFRKNYKLKGMDPKDVYIQVTDTRGRSKSFHFN